MHVDPARVAKGMYWQEGITLVSGCTPVSPGCTNCWSLACEKRFHREGPVTFHEDRLAHFAKGKPRTIAIWNDCLHEKVTDLSLEATRDTMAFHTQHRFIVLTKRAKRLVGWNWPKNVILGVTAENQHCLDERIPYLLQTQAACRMISAEPLLGPLVFNPEYMQCKGITVCDKLKGGAGPITRGDKTWCSPPCPPRIRWVVIGAESGPARRECKIEWIRDVTTQCQAANIPCFVKQLSINGKVSKNMAEWPSDLRVRELPNG